MMEHLPGSPHLEKEEEGRLSSLATSTLSYQMPLLSASGPYPLASSAGGSAIVPPWSGMVPGPPAMSTNMDSTGMAWDLQSSAWPHGFQYNTNNHGWSNQHLDSSIFSNQLSQQSQAFIVGSPNGDVTHRPNQQAISLDQAFDPHVPTVRYHCRWERCQNSTGFKRVSDIIRHIKEVHLAPDAYPCRVHGCGKTFNRAERLRHHERTHQPRIQPHVLGLRL
ncbi:hypothetical protein BJY00DRAFT_276195 [Aspergillus carlsbadensis]|nr:hypothetical protein BJY00DRAFT_276195 [Aspergillus carlsbadensis]